MVAVKVANDISCKAMPYTVGFRHTLENGTYFSTGRFFDWILLVLFFIVSRVDFIVFVLFLEAVDVREYCCMAVQNRLEALCFARSSRATRASRATNLRPSPLVALGIAENRQSYVRGVALSREPPKLQQASPLSAKWRRYRALLPSCDTRCRRT